MHTSKWEHVSFFIFFGIVSILLFFVFAPFIQLLTLAAVFAVLLNTPFEWLARELGGQRSIAAFLIVCLVLIFFIAPIFFLGTEIFKEAQSIYMGAQGNGPAYIHTFEAAIEAPVQRFVPGFSFDVSAYLGNVLAFISNNLASLVSQTLSVILETFLMLLSFFFFLRDGGAMLRSAAKASPFGAGETQKILRTMRHTVSSVVKGTLVVAIIRWVLVGVAFYLCGIPDALLWGSIGGVVGAIPGLGTPFVFIPAVAYLYIEGSLLGAIGLAVFGIAIIVFIDNMLTPYFFGKGLAVPSIFVLFSILGGVLFFGPLGLVLGPLVLSVFLSVLDSFGLVGHESAST